MATKPPGEGMLGGTNHRKITREGKTRNGSEIGTRRTRKGMELKTEETSKQNKKRTETRNITTSEEN